MIPATVKDVAVKEPDEEGNVEIKRKGWFAKTGLQKNCTGEIIMEAVCECLAHGTPVSRTIRNCNDIRKFIILRAVKGGAVWNGEFLGKVVRWYFFLICCHILTPQSNMLPTHTVHYNDFFRDLQLKSG